VGVGRAIRGNRGGWEEGEKLAALHGRDGSVVVEAGQFPKAGGGDPLRVGDDGRFAAEKGLATVGGIGLFYGRGRL
jgi:hypothetical protein